MVLLVCLETIGHNFHKRQIITRIEWFTGAGEIINQVDTGGSIEAFIFLTFVYLLHTGLSKPARGTFTSEKSKPIRKVLVNQGRANQKLLNKDQLQVTNRKNDQLTNPKEDQLKVTSSKEDQSRLGNPADDQSVCFSKTLHFLIGSWLRFHKMNYLAGAVWVILPHYSR